MTKLSLSYHDMLVNCAKNALSSALWIVFISSCQFSVLLKTLHLYNYDFSSIHIPFFLILDDCQSLPVSWIYDCSIKLNPYRCFKFSEAFMKKRINCMYYPSCRGYFCRCLSNTVLLWITYWDALKLCQSFNKLRLLHLKILSSFD